MKWRDVGLGMYVGCGPGDFFFSGSAASRGGPRPALLLLPGFYGRG